MPQLLDRASTRNQVPRMSNKPQMNAKFHDASDPRCTEHAQAKRFGHPVRRDRTCIKCLIERGFSSVGQPAESQLGRERRRRATRVSGA